MLRKTGHMQPSTQAFSSRSLDFLRNFVTSPNGTPFGDVKTFRAKSSDWEENAWVLGWVTCYSQSETEGDEQVLVIRKLARPYGLICGAAQ